MTPLLLLANLYSTWGLAAALAAICFVALRGNWFRQQRSRNSVSTPEDVRQTFPLPARETALATAPNDLLRWQVEMHETARDLKGEIDAKLLAFQALLTIANEHSQRLEKLLGEAEQAHLMRPAGVIGGREILDRIENGNCNLPPLTAAAMGRELLNDAQRKLIVQLNSENYSAAEIAPLIGASPVDVEWYLGLQQERLAALEPLQRAMTRISSADIISIDFGQPTAGRS
jgi:hypothetical protein